MPGPTFSREFVPEIAPERVRFPVPPTLQDEFKETVPDQVDVVPKLFTSAPPFEMPVPFKVTASVAALVNEKPFISNTAPELTVVPAEAVPKGPEVFVVEEMPSFNVFPELIVVAPEKVLAADN
ncbi:hypothetical protein D3C86_1513870 [compost metagenome]